MDLEEALKYTFPNKVNALSHTKWVLNYLIHTEQRRLQAAKDQESEHTFGADLAHSLLNKVPEANVAPEHAPLQSPDISSPEACAASTLARHVRTFVETHPDELNMYVVPVKQADRPVHRGAGKPQYHRLENYQKFFEVTLSTVEYIRAEGEEGYDVHDCATNKRKQDNGVSAAIYMAILMANNQEYAQGLSEALREVAPGMPSLPPFFQGKGLLEFRKQEQLSEFVANAKERLEARDFQKLKVHLRSTSEREIEVAYDSHHD